MNLLTSQIITEISAHGSEISASPKIHQRLEHPQIWMFKFVFGVGLKILILLS